MNPRDRQNAKTVRQMKNTTKTIAAEQHAADRGDSAAQQRANDATKVRGEQALRGVRNGMDPRRAARTLRSTERKLGL